MIFSARFLAYIQDVEANMYERNNTSVVLVMAHTIFRFPFKRKHFSPFLLFLTNILGFVKVLIKSLTGVVKKHRSSPFGSSRPEVFCKKVVLENFTKFTGKHLYQSLFFNKVQFLQLY